MANLEIISKSTVLVSAEVVIEKCQQVIDRVKQYNDDIQHDMIKDNCDRMNRKWWTKLFRKTPYTIKESETYLKENSRKIYCCSYPPRYGYTWLEHAHDLQRLAQQSVDGNVSLTVDDWVAIRDG